MPVIAESPPLVWGAAPPGEPIPPPVTPLLPPPTPTPPPITPVAPVRPPTVHTPTELVIKHQEFMTSVDSQSSCFKKSDIVGFTDEEFNVHIQIAMVDKYLTQEKDLYCSRQAVHNLSTKLKRYVG